MSSFVSNENLMWQMWLRCVSPRVPFNSTIVLAVTRFLEWLNWNETKGDDTHCCGRRFAVNHFWNCEIPFSLVANCTIRMNFRMSVDSFVMIFRRAIVQFLLLTVHSVECQRTCVVVASVNFICQPNVLNLQLNSLGKFFLFFHLSISLVRLILMEFNATLEPLRLHSILSSSFIRILTSTLVRIMAADCRHHCAADVVSLFLIDFAYFFFLWLRSSAAVETPKRFCDDIFIVVDRHQQ